MGVLRKATLFYAGSSSGIGAETAVLLASLGAFVTLTGRSEEKLQQVAQRCATKRISKQKVRQFCDAFCASEPFSCTPEEVGKFFWCTDL